MERKINFWQLLEEYKIEIPKIQRAYAQGRLDEKTELLVEDFLNDIKEAILKDKPLNLNFIYGKVENGTLIPIDGQQRLTTLFLLHWYFLVKENKLKDYKNELQRFTYETRLTSIDFCKGLVENGKDFVELLKNSYSKISDSIKDSSWYFSSWEHDPTIVSMLNMIDKLHEKFKDVECAVFEKLQGDDSPITFYFLPMEDFKLTDELYIKMNERGKQLTDFENFKTLFSGYLEIDEKSKLDNEWLDIFWNMEKDEAKKDGREMLPNNVDKNYYQFFQNITFLFYAENNTVEDIEKYSLFKDYATVYSNQEYVKKIIYVFNALTAYKDDESIFKKFISDEPSYWERVRFYALCCYFVWNAKNKECDIDGNIHHNWMRIARNLINNTPIGSPEYYKNVIIELKKLAEHIDNILEYISKFENKMLTFPEIQQEEEKLKAQLILKDDEWQPLFETAEEHPYFDGQVGFILKYAGVKKGEYSKKDFENYSSKLMHLFSDSFKENHNFLFQRALLSKGNYLIEVKSNYSFCDFNGTSLRAKGENWRKVFNNSKRSLILKALLDDIKGDDILVELKRIVKNQNTNDWRDIIIKNPKCISYCSERKIRFEDDKIYLISKTQMNSHHAELFSYNLFQKVFEGNEYKPFSSVRYYESTSYYKQPCIALDSFIYKKHEFYMNIQYAGSGNYNLIFSYKADRKPVAFDDISNILQKLGFKKGKTDLTMSGIIKAEVEKRVKEICQNLIEQLEL